MRTAEEKKPLEIPTPFGTVHLPSIEEALPKFPPEPLPKMDERRSKAMTHAVATDLSTIIGIVPIIGDIAADVVEDLHGAELRKILTKEEMDRYVIHDKVAPSTIALIRAFKDVPVKP